MASKTSITDESWSGRTLDMGDFGRSIAVRKAQLGLPELPRNAGKNRTPSKRALLKAIKDIGGNW